MTQRSGDDGANPPGPTVSPTAIDAVPPCPSLTLNLKSARDDRMGALPGRHAEGWFPGRVTTRGLNRSASARSVEPSGTRLMSMPPLLLRNAPSMYVVTCLPL